MTDDRGRPKRHSALPPTLAPRGLSRAEAAAYIGVAPTKFEEMIEDGRMPKPVGIDGRKIWDRHAVDRAFDELSDVATRPGPPAPNLPPPEPKMAAAEAPPASERGELLSLLEVKRLLSLSRSTIYRKMAEGTFPRPLIAGENTVRWFRKDIDAWTAGLPVSAARMSELKRPEVFSPESLGAWWQCSAQQVRHLCKAGEIRHFRSGTMIRIPADAVDEFESSGGSRQHSKLRK